MMKNVNKQLAAGLAAVMVFSLSASAALADADSESVAEPAALIGMPNPVHEMTAEEVLAETGFAFQEVAGSEDISYAVIDGENPIAQMTFTYDGREWTYRLCACAEEQDISGMYYTWKKHATVDVDYNEATAQWIKKQQGVISWFDVVPGVMYSLSVNTGADKDVLSDMANTLFYPLQGDAVSDFDADFTDLLYDIQQNYHYGVAGCSLRAACLAAEGLDLFTEYHPVKDTITNAVALFADSLSGDDAADFPGQVDAVIAAGQKLLGEDGQELLDSCGYTSDRIWDAETLTPYLEAMAISE